MKPFIQTPVALILFNRPDLTKKVFEVIARVRPKKLFVIADGPRFPEEIEKCKEARSVVEMIDWECEVLKNYSDSNMGCKERISSGLNWVFSETDEAIILEDDCLPHPSFFKFCEILLEEYRHDERVMMISGDNFLLNMPKIKESYLFSRYFSIWGWATWRRAWEKYDIHMKYWKSFKEYNQLECFYSHKGVIHFLTEIFDNIYNSKIDAWGPRWFYSCLFNNGLSIVPKVNLISNIGILGAHSSKISENHNLPVFSLDFDQMQHPSMVYPNCLYDHKYFERSFRFYGSRSAKAFLKLKLILKNKFNRFPK